MQSSSHLPVDSGLPPVHESWLPREHGLYRPRHSRHQRTALCCALVFFLAPVLALSVGMRAQAFENKALNEFPSPASGWGFFTGLSGWATDHLPLRQSGVQAANWISESIFRERLRFERPAGGGPIGVERDDRPAPRYPDVIYGQDGWLYIGEDVSNKCLPRMSLDAVADAVNRLRRAVESSGRRFELVVAPDKSTMVPEFLPDDYVGRDCAQSLTARFWGHTIDEIGAIDLRQTLVEIEQRESKRLYDPTDTHWSYEGGIAMTYAVAERLEPGITASWVVGKGKVQRWPADLAQFVGKPEDRRLRKYRLAPDGDEDRTRYVASDFRTPLRLEVPDSSRSRRGSIEANTGVIADSFTQFASPFLPAAFDDVVIVHPETVAQDPTRVATELLVDRETIVLELAERNIAGGTSPLLRPAVIDSIAAALLGSPR